MLLYLIGFLFYFLFQLFKQRDKLFWALSGAAYFTGAEVFLRMTKSFIFYETGKYGVMLFCLLGMFFIGFKRNAAPYLIYFLLLLPAVWVAYDQLSFDLNFRKSVLFNLSGPICLSVAAVFTFGRTLKLEQLLKVLDFVVYPLIAMTVYVILYTPSDKEVFINTASNVAASGGFGANQVSTVLGMGFFILLTRFFLPYKNVVVHWSMMLFMALMGYRALLTFSRGGVLVGLLVGAIFIGIYFLTVSLKTKTTITMKLMVLFFGAILLWGYSEVQTGGMITNRYTNKDALGREKEDITTGRGDLAEAELDAFKENPIFGLGVGRVRGYFEEEIGVTLPTHNEVTRMFSEHGLFGILALLTLIFAPIITKLQGRKNIYFWSFLLFWFLTISHSSMRIAAPAFIYALCLLNIDYAPEKKAIVHRKQAITPRPVTD